MMKTFTKTLVVAVALTASACSSGDQPVENRKKAVATIKEETEVEVHPTIVLPSPLQVASLFKKAGLMYAPGWANSPGNETRYSDNFSKAMAYGTYSADLAYFVVTRQNQEALNALKVLRNLSDDIGLSATLTQEFISRFETNLGNEDSLTNILEDLQMAIDETMADNEQEGMQAVIYSAAWIESMYLGGRSYEKKASPALGERLSEQRVILDNLIKALETSKRENNNVKNLLSSLTSIRSSFNTTSGDEVPVLTSEQMKALSATVAAVRSKIINGEVAV